jgi:CRISPR-associated protein Csm5
MTPVTCYQLHITPLSPIHIGTGESYEPTNYVIEDGVLYEFDTGATLAALSASDRAVLLKIADRRPNAEMIQDVQRFFYERRRGLMAHAIHQVPVLEGVARLYASRVGQVANREADGKTVINRLEIDRTAYNPVTRQPVLYGSSLKGAIRTALLDKINNGQPAREQKGLHEFQGRLFGYYNANTHPRIALERDPMRLVQLADATWRGEPGLPATRVYLAVNRKKAPVVDEKGVLRKSMAESKELYQLLECMPGWHYRAFSGQLNLQRVSGLSGRQKELPDKQLWFTAQDIAQACNRFYCPILEAENRLLRKRGYLDANWDKAIQQLLAQADDKMRRGEAFLLRVGRHSGAESVTLNGVRNIRIIKGKGEQPAHLDAAKTVWLAADEKDQMTGLVPFGWLLVELQPLDHPATDWPTLQAACEPHLTAARALRDKLAAQRAYLEQAKAEAEARRREEEERARRLAEEEAERQARLAAMSENMRRIQEFKADFANRAAQLRGKRDKPNTSYHDKARQLAKDALEGKGWTAEERRAAAEAIAEWLPKVVQVDMKQERKKLKLANLHGEA